MAHQALVDAAIHEAVSRTLVSSKNAGRFGVGHQGNNNNSSGGLGGNTAGVGGGTHTTTTTGTVVGPPQQLDQFLFNPQTRTRCYQAALKIAQDRPKLKLDVANLLLLHLSGFVPQISVLMAVRDFAAANSSDGVEYRELQRLADIQFIELQRYSGESSTLLPPSPHALARGSSQRAGSPQPTDQQHPHPHLVNTEGSSSGTLNALPSVGGGKPYHYATLPALRGPLVENSRRIVMGLPPAHEVAVVAIEKNSKVIRAATTGHQGERGGYPDKTMLMPIDGATITAPVNYNIVHCRDVTSQTPLAVTEDLLQQQIKILISYNNNYSTSPSVGLATRMFIKLLLDSYRKRLKLQPYDQHMRVATCAFLTPLLALVGSEWQNIKLQVYEILTNLAVQTQLFDRSTVDGLPGASVESECWWMLAQTLQRDFLLRKKDRESDTIWFAALKCTMFILPPHLLATYVDPRVLSLFCNLPGVSENSVGLYALLLDALATRCCCGFSSRHLQWKLPRASRTSTGGPSSYGTTRTTGKTNGGGHPSSASSLLLSSAAAAASSFGVGVHSRTASGVNVTQQQVPDPAAAALPTAATKPTALLHNDGDSSQPLLQLDPEVYQLVGGDVTLTQLYSKATTAAARDSAFTVLYCSAVLQGQQDHHTRPQHLQQEGQHQTVVVDPRVWTTAATTLSAVVRLGLPWQFHTFLLYQTGATAKELTQQLVLDIPRETPTTEKTFLLSTVSRVVEITFNHTQALPLGLEGLNLRTAALLLPGLVKDGDSVVQTAALAAAVAAIHHEVTRKLSDHDIRKGISRDCMPLFRALAGGPVTTTTQRQCNVQLLERLGALSRILPAAVHAYTQFYDLILNQQGGSVAPNGPGGGGTGNASTGSAGLTTSTDGPLLTTVQYLPMYRSLVGLLTRQPGPHRGEGDISEQCLSGALQVVQTAADQVGSQLLWSLYFALRPLEGIPMSIAQLEAAGSGAAGAAANRARHVLVNILAPMSTKDAASDLYIWSRVLEDPYPAVAVIGSQQVIKNCGLAHYDRYEAAITQAERGQKPSAVLKSAFHMASSIVGK